MGRHFAKTNFGIWQDPDWRALPWPAQYLYKLLWDHPDLSYCGVVDWRPGRLRMAAGGWSEHALLTMADCLRARHFLVVDEESEEALLRSWIRFDGLMKQPTLAASMAKAFAATSSNEIRGVIADELVKLKERQPDLAGWNKPQVVELLTHPRLRAKELPVPADPLAGGFELVIGHPPARVISPLGSPPGSPPSSPLTSPLGSGSTPVEPAPFDSPPGSHPPYNSNYNNNPPASQEGGVGGTTSDPSPGKKTSGRKRPARALPGDWSPNDKHEELARQRGLDLEREATRFRDHAEANDRRQANWDAAFRQWLNSPFAKAGSSPGQYPGGRAPKAGEIAEDGTLLPPLPEPFN